ncbi:MAG: WXG100 family type VII secretion target [Oscillospiraceae bacterium]|nr:WXG100 family type VII secretion target [Oscillospiraceae bacterium]
MDKQTVNTDGIAAAAKKLQNVNENINSKIETLKNTARALGENWIGKAGTCAHGKIYEILKQNERRDRVMQDYIATLEKKVDPNYVVAENTNILAADFLRDKFL